MLMMNFVMIGLSIACEAPVSVDDEIGTCVKMHVWKHPRTTTSRQQNLTPSHQQLCKIVLQYVALSHAPP